MFCYPPSLLLLLLWFGCGSFLVSYYNTTCLSSFPSLFFLSFLLSLYTIEWDCLQSILTSLSSASMNTISWRFQSSHIAYSIWNIFPLAQATPYIHDSYLTKSNPTSLSCNIIMLLRSYHQIIMKTSTIK